MNASEKIVAVNVEQDKRSQDEIDLRMVWNVLWEGKYILIPVVFVAALVSVFYALSLPNIYRSNAVLAAAPGQGQDGGGGISSQLKSLAGGAFGAQEVDRVSLAIEVIKSRKFVKELSERHNITVPLMAGERWDPETRKLILDADLYDVETKQWVREVKPPRESRPADWEVYKKYREVVSISQDPETGFVELSVDSLSPELSQKWVSLIIDDINMTLREKDIARANKRIIYLQKKLEEIKSADIKNVFYSLIEDELRNKMLAETQKDYVFDVIDPAVKPGEKYGPKRALICILGTFLGGLLGIMIVSMRYSWRRGVETVSADEA